MSRITMALENDFEGRVLASFDLDEFANKIRAEVIDELLDISWHSIDLKDFRGEVMKLKERI